MKTSQKIYLPFKRFLDIILSIIGILLCVAMLWWWAIPINAIVTKGHPFFSQERIGKNGKPFKILKFRSMFLDVDPNKTSLALKYTDSRTKFGTFLRRFSIDETPQLLNIFVGQMSFIGPRPLIDKDEDHTTIELRKQNGSIVLKPGLSGYAQTHGREEVYSERKAAMDLHYLEKMSFWFDFIIFGYTILKCIGLARGRKDKGKTE